MMKTSKPTLSNLNETNRPALAHMLGVSNSISESANPIQRVLTACLALFALSIFILDTSMAMEYDTDRGGSDYKNFDLTQADPVLCQTNCSGEAQCKAWTYVKPGIQGPKARCWLKTSVPAAKPNTCCVSGVKQGNPPLNSALSAHGNTDWHIDTANEFLFGVDMAGNATAPNHAPDDWTKTHIHTGLTNTAKYYYDKTRIASGDDTNATNGIDRAMLFFYAGHGNPTVWNTLGDNATQTNVLLANIIDNGTLRYYWQCSCEVFAHGPRMCTGSTMEYACPQGFTGAADSNDMRNVFQRWGPALSPDLRMACGVSTLAYCHENNVNKIWDNYNNRHMRVADAFINGLGDWGVVPLCITRGGANITATPLYDSTFTSDPNQSKNTHYHILYASGTGTTPVSASAEQAIPPTLPKFRVVPAEPSARLRGLDLRSGQPASLAVTAFAGGAAQARVEPASGAVYLFSEQKPAAEGRALQERDYVERASNVIRELGWDNRELGQPNVTLLLAASMPVKGEAGSIQQTQRGANVTYRRQMEVEGKLIPVVGEGGLIEVMLNNDGVILNASRVWRTVQGASASNRVKRFEEARNEAVAKLDKPDVYRLDQWRWGYKELAGNVKQDELKVVFQFAFVPKNPQDMLQYPPRLIEIPGQEN